MLILTYGFLVEEAETSESRAKKGINSALRAIQGNIILATSDQGYNSDEDVQHQSSYEILEQTVRVIFISSTVFFNANYLVPTKLYA